MFWQGLYRYIEIPLLMPLALILVLCMFALEMGGGPWEPATWAEYGGVRMRKWWGQ